MGEILFYALAGLVGGVYLFFLGFKKLWKKRLIQNIPTSKVRSLAMGLVELSGKAVPDVVLTAPYTKSECVFYHIITERLVTTRTKHGYSRRWVKEFEMKTDIPFFLQDDTASVLIDPHEASLDLPLRYSHTENNRREKEYYIGVREYLYVLGTAQKTDTTEEQIHKEVERRLQEIIEDPDEKIKLDLNNDLWIDEDEWQAARDKLRMEVQAEFMESEKAFQRSHEVPDYLKNVVIGKGVTDKYFILSNRSETELIRHYHQKAVLFVFGGSILTVICLKILLSLKGS